MVPGSEFNIKITVPLDLHLADTIFQINSLRISGIINEHTKNRVSGKVLVVFGGTSGIGEKIAQFWSLLGGKLFFIF